jgi:acyl-coenzyme A synthetase/AMP-(fatty) acid ligase
MHQLFESIGRHAARNSAAPALCSKARVLSYSELSNALSRLYGFFDGRKLAPGSKVFVNIADSDMRSLVHLACIHYGLIPFLVFNPSQVPGQVDHDIVIGANDPLVTDLPADILVNEAIFTPGAPPLSSWPGRTGSDSDLVLVASTSGTTGLWKLIGETCGHFRFQMDKSHDFGIGDRIMVILGELTLTTLRMTVRTYNSGATLVRASQDPLTCLKLINLFAVNKLVLTPKALERLMDLMAEMSIECPSVKNIAVTGSLFTKPVLRRAEDMFDAQFVVLYGSHEVGGIASGQVESSSFEPGYVGRIRDYLDVHIDAENEGEPGQIVLRNDPILIQKYYADGAIVPNEEAHFRMPDIGVIRDNCLYLSGRDDEVFNFSGDKIAYSEMVGHLLADDTVGDAAIVRQPDDPDPFALKIVIVEKGAVDLESLKALLCEKLGRRTLAKHLDMRIVGQIPRNASDKVDREALLRLFTAD